MDVAELTKSVAVGFAGVLAAVIVGISLWLWFQPDTVFTANKDAFQLVVTQTLLPMFTGIAAAVLAYIFARTALNAVEVYSRSSERLTDRQS
jgi:hypothetical protein